MPSVTFTFSLDTQDYASILEWLGEQENASAAIRKVLDAHVQNQIQLVDVYREVVALQEQVAALRVHGVRVDVTGSEIDSQQEVQEAPEVALALDSLGVD